MHIRLDHTLLSHIEQLGVSLTLLFKLSLQLDDSFIIPLILIEQVGPLLLTLTLSILKFFIGCFICKYLLRLVLKQSRTILRISLSQIEMIDIDLSFLLLRLQDLSQLSDHPLILQDLLSQIIVEQLVQRCGLLLLRFDQIVMLALQL